MAGGSKRKASRPAPAPPNTAAGKSTRPYTGKEFLASLDDDREVWIYGERVKNITTHPAFQNTARMLARLYDALIGHEREDVLTMPTEGGASRRTSGATNVDGVAGRDPIAAWSRRTMAGSDAPPTTSGLPGHAGAHSDSRALPGQC